MLHPFPTGRDRPLPPLVTTLGAALLALWAAAEPPTAPPPAREAVTVRLLLRTGESLTGALRNDTFTLRTAAGLLRLPGGELTAIRLTKEFAGLDTITTRYGDRFSGWLETPRFLLETTTAGSLEIRRERVRQAIFRTHAVASRKAPPKQTLRLRNGDVLQGRFLNDALPIVTAQGPVTPALATLSAATFPGPTRARIQLRLRDGRELEGDLTLEDLDFRLAVGPTLRIYRGRIATIERYREPPATGAGSGGPSELGQASGSAPAAAGAKRPADRPGLIWIPPGEFTLGSPREEADRGLDEGPPTRVTLTQGFWMGRCEVTQAEYEAVTGANPSQYTGDPRRPVERVSWEEAVSYCRKLTEQQRARGDLPPNLAYRLPTEAEWEYACRAGTATRFSFGNDPDNLQLHNHAWYLGNSGSATHPVGTRQPNPWGIHDMHGNVWEWCLDCWEGAYPGGQVTDPLVRSDSSLRVARGGSWLYEASFCRSANRDDYTLSNQCSDLGFRVVLAPVSSPPTAAPNGAE